MKISLILHLVNFAGGTVLEAYSSSDPITVDSDDEAETLFHEFRSLVAMKAQHASNGNNTDILTVYPREADFDYVMITTTAWRNSIPRVYLKQHE